MIVEASLTVKGSRDEVWAVVSNIKDAAEIVRGIEKIEIVEVPISGLNGLSWRETRMYFGKPSTVVKKVTDAREREGYTVTSEVEGYVFLTRLTLLGEDGNITLTSAHETRAIGLLAKIKSLPMIFFRRMMKKAILEDLKDYRSTIERS